MNHFSTISVSSENLDHLGIVSATFKDLGLLEKINSRIPNRDPRRIVSTGQAVLAMVLNGLGFTNRRLYLMPQFFQDKPIEALIGEGLEAKHLDDHALGKALDEISEYGTTQFFGEIAMEVGMEQGFFGKTSHLDSTSFSVEGEYTNQEEGFESIHVTHGYSKDRRPDLKQIMLSMCTTGSMEFPFWIKPQSGNSSDKKEFHKIIQRVEDFKKHLKNGPAFRWISDSALYSKEGILRSNLYKWISRVPETISEAKALVQRSNDDICWSTKDENGYKIAPFLSEYGGIKQRWILVSSNQAFIREKKTFEKALEKKKSFLEKELWHFSHQIFGCREDLQSAFDQIKRKYPLFEIEVQSVAIMKNSKVGRPGEDSEKIQKGFQANCKFALNETEIQKILNSKGRFILATNDFNQDELSDFQILQEYKKQQGVERGFRFLKDPWFMVSSIFLKSPRRIEALMVIMTFCLMIYNVAQGILREKLTQTQQKIPNQLGKPIQTPTLRWIFQIMEGVCRVTISDKAEVVKIQTTNMTSLRVLIVKLFGPTCQEIYGLI